jgi:hypothetical protein
MIQSFKYLGQLYSMKVKDEMIQSIDPSSLTYLVPQMFGFIVSNGIIALVIARFTMFKPDRNDWLKQDIQE